MSSLKLNQGSEFKDLVNKRNQWLFFGKEITEYLAKRNYSLFIPSGNIWYSSFSVYASYSYNLLKIIYFLVKQLFSDKTSFQKKSTHIVFSARGGYDLKNYNRLSHDNNVEEIHLEAFNTSQKINFNIVTIKSIFSFLLENLREANKILKLKLPQELRKNIINHSLPQLAIYTYLCAFLSAIKEQIPNVKIFHTGAILLSSAAMRAELETVYLTHGLVGKNQHNMFFFSDHVYVYSDEEKSYFENRSPKSNVCLYPVKELSKLEKRVIIFSSPYDRDMSEKTILEVLAPFLKKDYKIFFKKHPIYKGSLVDKIAEEYNLELTGSQMDASEIILNLRPSFTVSWRSTALCESLQIGVIPVSLSGDRFKPLSTQETNGTFKDSTEPLYWTIYPVWKRSLSWMEEKERIFELLEDNSLYKKTLSELRMR